MEKLTDSQTARLKFVLSKLGGTCRNNNLVQALFDKQYICFQCEDDLICVRYLGNYDGKEYFYFYDRDGVDNIDFSLLVPANYSIIQGIKHFESIDDLIDMLKEYWLKNALYADKEIKDLLVLYEGGGYDGCLWEWNAFIIDKSGKYHNIYSSGSMGIEKPCKESLNDVSHIYFTDSEEEIEQFSKEHHACNVLAFGQEIAHRIDTTEYFFVVCDRCGNQANPEYAMGIDYAGDGGVGYIPYGLVCEDCYSELNWEKKQEDFTDDFRYFIREDEEENYEKLFNSLDKKWDEVSFYELYDKLKALENQNEDAARALLIMQDWYNDNNKERDYPDGILYIEEFEKGYKTPEQRYFEAHQLVLM